MEIYEQIKQLTSALKQDALETGNFANYEKLLVLDNLILNYGHSEWRRAFDSRSKDIEDIFKKLR